MTKVNKLAKFYNVQSHNEQDVLKDLLENHLSGRYTKRVIEKLKFEGIAVSSSYVRNVYGGFKINTQVFNAIIEVAKENKAISDRLKENLQNNSTLQNAG